MMWFWQVKIPYYEEFTDVTLAFDVWVPIKHVIYMVVEEERDEKLKEKVDEDVEEELHEWTDVVDVMMEVVMEMNVVVEMWVKVVVNEETVGILKSKAAKRSDGSRHFPSSDVSNPRFNGRTEKPLLVT